MKMTRRISTVVDSDELITLDIVGCYVLLRRKLIPSEPRLDAYMDFEKISYQTCWSRKTSEHVRQTMLIEKE